jgi:ABC-type multidrug transport system fused ATPase/permease subunit
MSYFKDGKPALNSVNFTIRPEEKVGVVGRTGSGKSSLIIALFRLCEPEEGKIFVDEDDTSRYGLSDLRSHLAIIPQEPVLFKGTVRSNLDPFDRYNDTQLWDAIGLAHLKDTVNELPEKLESPVAENGDNFSLGQKQLFCLARAILNKSKVLVLDEATAAMDLETDSLIRHTIRRVFADRTVITIAHRLDTIIDSDRILVMDAGHVLEFDTPAALLSLPNSSFSQLVEQCGSSAQALREAAIAHKPYHAHHE